MSLIESYLIKYGFIFPSNEIYGRLQNLWDYGHLGSLLKENIKKEWLNFFVHKQENSFLLDCAIFSGKSVWEASGHLNKFHDILIDCKKCKKRFREDLLEEKVCSCGSKSFTEPQEFNLMFKSNEYYLRPETAQSIFINFKNILNTTGAKLPFSVAQVGKAFRNEITTQNSIFRTREFEQMELELFDFPSNSSASFDLLLKQMKDFLINHLTIKADSIEIVEIPKDKRAHYSSKSVDIFYKFEHGISELWGLANRQDFDLLAHQNKANVKLHYFDVQNNTKVIPHVVEHSIGLNRLFLALITDAFEVDELNERELLKINRKLAPYKFAIFPLTKKEVTLAHSLYKKLLNLNISVFYDEKGSIGKRYKKQDAIGTPFCLTIDAQSVLEEENMTFTSRERDSMKQRRINFEDLIKDEQFSWN